MVSLELNVPSGRELPLARVEEAVGEVFRRLEGDPGELSITFLEDAPIRELNLRYLDHDWVPDVLSFDLGDPSPQVDGCPTPLGDIYIGWQQAARQAEEHGVSLEEELVRLAVHGTLHVLGMDHPEAPEERTDSELYRIQEEVVRGVMAGEADPRSAPYP